MAWPHLFLIHHDERGLLVEKSNDISIEHCVPKQNLVLTSLPADAVSSKPHIGHYYFLSGPVNLSSH